MWLDSLFDNAVWSLNPDLARCVAEMKMKTLFLLETTEQELDIASQIEMSQRIISRDMVSDPETVPIQKTHISELTSEEAYSLTRFRKEHLLVLLSRWRLEGVTLKLRGSRHVVTGEGLGCV